MGISLCTYWINSQIRLFPEEAHTFLNVSIFSHGIWISTYICPIISLQKSFTYSSRENIFPTLKIKLTLNCAYDPIFVICIQSSNTLHLFSHSVEFIYSLREEIYTILLSGKDS